MWEIVFLFMGAILIFFFWMAGIRIIPNNFCAIVEKRMSSRGSLKDRIIALNKEAGYQPEILRGGLHIKPRYIFSIHKIPLVTIPRGQIGYVFARDGVPLKPSQTLGRIVEESHDFQSVRGFLENNGQRGPQRGILREGTYAINLSQFVVILENRIYYWQIGHDDSKTFEWMSEQIRREKGFRPITIQGSEDNIGIVTVHDGPPLSPGEIIAPLVGAEVPGSKANHNHFQDPETFLESGGRRGKQYQVLVDGTYFINRLFATVEIVPKTIVPVGYVGVVVSYVGSKGIDESGIDYKHGELVEVGKKGVWKDSLMPGKYPFNIYAGMVILVPTTNIVLKWIKNVIGSHKLDENLSAIDLITKDAFEPELPLSVVIHIDYRRAPLVIQRFGDVKKLVDQTLDPMVAAYFKNIGQTRTLIELIQERSAIQATASSDMKEKFAHYDLELEEVLIGTPASSTNDGRIEQILVQLRDRQIAREKLETFQRQQEASVKERELNEARARAKQQEFLTESEIGIDIQKNQGRAEYERSVQEAMRIRTLAEASAERQARVGIAQALAIQEKVRAYGGPRYQVLQQSVDRFSRAIEESKVDVVPKMVIGQGEGSYSAFESLMFMIMSEKMGMDMSALPKEGEAVKRIKKGILASLEGKVEEVVT
ncbi:MAG: SPFH domain-containing protein [Candidatus Thermoplasmatota archaeon]|nr:SPFH domain-containing protein [Candidatus Thermoplasmatota archaeon]